MTHTTLDMSAFILALRRQGQIIHICICFLSCTEAEERRYINLPTFRTFTRSLTPAHFPPFPSKHQPVQHTGQLPVTLCGNLCWKQAVWTVWYVLPVTSAEECKKGRVRVNGASSVVIPTLKTAGTLPWPYCIFSDNSCEAVRSRLLLQRHDKICYLHDCLQPLTL